MFMKWYDFDTWYNICDKIYMFMIWHVVIRYVMAWYVEGIHKLCYNRDCDIWYDMIWYDMYIMRIVMSGSMKTLWCRICTQYEWYDMIDMKNDEPARGQEGAWTDWWVHTHMYGLCVGKLSTHQIAR